MKGTVVLILVLISAQAIGQNRIGINTSSPDLILDVRGTDDDLSGGEIQLATPSIAHFVRIFGGRGLDPEPFLLFANTDTFRIATSESDYSKFTELLTIRPDGNIGIGEMHPTQKLEVDGKVKIGNDGSAAEAGTLRYNATQSTFDGYNGDGWMRLDNKLVYQDAKMSTSIGDTKRNLEQPWGDTITIPESGNYMFYVSAYFSSTINEQYASGSPSIKYDNRGRLKIYINGVSHKLLECGNGIIDRDDSQLYMSFAPGTRSYMEVITFSAGDEISLTRNMQAVPASTPNLSIPDLWLASMDAFYILKLD